MTFVCKYKLMAFFFFSNITVARKESQIMEKNVVSVFFVFLRFFFYILSRQTI